MSSGVRCGWSLWKKLPFLPGLAQRPVYIHKFPSALPVVSAALRPPDASLICKEAAAQVFKGALPPSPLFEGLHLRPMICSVSEAPDFFGVFVTVDRKRIFDEIVVIAQRGVWGRVHPCNIIISHKLFSLLISFFFCKLSARRRKNTQIPIPMEKQKNAFSKPGHSASMMIKQKAIFNKFHRQPNPHTPYTFSCLDASVTSRNWSISVSHPDRLLLYKY